MQHWRSCTVLKWKNFWTRSFQGLGTHIGKANVVSKPKKTIQYWVKYFLHWYIWGNKHNQHKLHFWSIFTPAINVPCHHPSINLNRMSPEEYRDTFWAMLRDAIDQVGGIIHSFFHQATDTYSQNINIKQQVSINQMLTHPPGSYKPISYEQMYSAVYKWVTFLFTS